MVAPAKMKGTDGMEIGSNSEQEIGQGTLATRSPDLKSNASKDNDVGYFRKFLHNLLRWSFSDDADITHINKEPTDVNEQHSEGRPISVAFDPRSNRMSIEDVCVDLESCIGMSAMSHTTCRELNIKSSTTLVRSARQKQMHEKAKTSLEVIRISADHGDSKIDLHELLTLLSETCPKLKSLEVEAGKCVLGDLHHVKRMRLPSLKNLNIAVKEEIISEKQRIDLLHKIEPPLTGGTVVRWKSRNYTWGNIGRSGASLQVVPYGFTLNVPKGALNKETYVSIAVLTEVPKDAQLKIEKSDMIISYGFKCTPAGQTFKRPVTIHLPHCAILSGKSLNNVVLYRTENDQDFVRTPVGQNSDLVTCNGEEGEIGIQLSHFSRGFVSQADSVAKRISLMCFISDQMPESRKPILRVYLFDDLKGSREDIRSEERSLYKDEQSSREVESGEILDIYNDIKDLHIECTLLNGRPCKSKPKIIGAEVLRNLVKRKEMFVLNLEKRPDDTNFELLLKRVEERELIYKTGYKSKGRNQSSTPDDRNHGGPSSRSRQLKKSKGKRMLDDDADVNQPGPSSSGSSPRRSNRKRNRRNTNDPITEDDILLLSQLLPESNYDDMAVKLRVRGGYNKGKNIKKNQTTDAAYRELLFAWKNATLNPTKGMLDDILKDCDLEGLIDRF